MIQSLLFIAFSALLLGSAVMVISLQHPMRSALFLVVCFFAATGLWLLLTAEFLALVLILVYVGAVMTLFLFVVMTLQLDLKNIKHPYLKFYLPIGLLITALFVALLIYALNSTASPWIQYASNHELPQMANVNALGNVLYTQYALPFEMAAIILLVAMICAISLTLFEPINHKRQSIEAQISVSKKDRLKIIK